MTTDDHVITDEDLGAWRQCHLGNVFYGFENYRWALGRNQRQCFLSWAVELRPAVREQEQQVIATKGLCCQLGETHQGIGGHVIRCRWCRLDAWGNRACVCYKLTLRDAGSNSTVKKSSSTESNYRCGIQCYRPGGSWGSLYACAG